MRHRDTAGRRWFVRELARQKRVADKHVRAQFISAAAMNACRWIGRGAVVILVSLTLATAIGLMTWKYVSHTIPEIEQLRHHVTGDCLSRGDRMYACVINTFETMLEGFGYNTYVAVDWIWSNINSILHVIILAFTSEMFAMLGVVFGTAVITYGILCILAKLFVLVAPYLPHEF
jgi:hypothetical protein